MLQVNLYPHEFGQGRPCGVWLGHTRRVHVMVRTESAGLSGECKMAVWGTRRVRLKKYVRSSVTSRHAPRRSIVRMPAQAERMPPPTCASHTVRTTWALIGLPFSSGIPFLLICTVLLLAPDGEFGTLSLSLVESPKHVPFLDAHHSANLRNYYQAACSRKLRYKRMENRPRESEFCVFESIIFILQCGRP